MGSNLSSEAEKLEHEIRSLSMQIEDLELERSKKERRLQDLKNQMTNDPEHRKELNEGQIFDLLRNVRKT